MSAIEASWRALEAWPGNFLHQRFDWCAAWAVASGNGLVLVEGRVGGNVLFILPLEIVHGRGGRTARFIGSPHSNGNTGLFAPDWAEHLPGMATMLARRLPPLLAGRADLILFDKVPAVWGGFVQPLAQMPSTRHQNASYQLPILADFEATLRQLNAGNRRRKFRVTDRKLKALGGYRHIRAQTASEKARLLDLFFAQKATRFRAQNLPDVFADPKIQAFFHGLAAYPQGASFEILRLDALVVDLPEGERVAAVAGLSRKGEHLLCQFSSIDDRLSQDASPGEMLFHLIIEGCVGEGVTLFDFGIGDQLYKRSWCTRETVLSDVTLPITARGRAAMLAYRATVAMKTAIKRNSRLYAALQALRRRFKADDGAGAA
ncbi:hypothetical protein BJF93_09995 [Xaviernesmea oryzae]|uniref:BioF2-like acetyltransferase domain-containing protein n=2 Tax=Xaviernesmea oryzae TaxID=464029 RepID=A0A1Q9AXF9_9HYPH|nr:hypothetical protein BJF93_09995 [Xaviernesmea oryzae]